jgi:hypothetical protein
MSALPEFLTLAREAASAAACALLTDRPFVIAESASAKDPKR